jgi:molybdenum cofactor cytidylyltransferase
MGEAKALLRWGDSTLLEYQAAELAAAGVAETVVVFGAQAEDIRAHLPERDGLRAVVNPDYALGKTTSIKAGVRACGPDTGHFLIIGVDQPRPRAVLETVIRRHVETGAAITVPAHRGRRGHPPMFRADLRDELLSIREETLGLREVLLRRAREVSVVEVDSPAVLVDLNSPQQYAEARKVSWGSS